MKPRVCGGDFAASFWRVNSVLTFGNQAWARFCVRAPLRRGAAGARVALGVRDGLRNWPPFAGIVAPPRCGPAFRAPASKGPERAVRGPDLELGVAGRLDLQQRSRRHGRALRGRGSTACRLRSSVSARRRNAARVRTVLRSGEGSSRILLDAIVLRRRRGGDSGRPARYLDLSGSKPRRSPFLIR